MRIKSVGRGLLCVVAVMGLVACGTKHAAKQGAAASSGQARYADANGSYPMYAGEGYRGGSQRDQQGRLVNSMTAPAEQTYYFNFDRSRVQASDLAAIQVQARYLVAHPRAKVRLEGNTDDIGSREYNVGLGWRRDQAVARYLEQQGVRPNQLEMVSYGKERPARLGDSDSARALNRRVHMVYEVK